MRTTLRLLLSGGRIRIATEVVTATPGEGPGLRRSTSRRGGVRPAQELADL